MSQQDNIKALKKLCAKIKGGTTTAYDIKGTTIAEVIEEITKEYTGKTPLTLGTLTVSSAAGATIGFTKISITESTNGLMLRYKTDASNVVAPARDENLTAWKTWDGVAELKIENGHKIYVAEVDGSNLALKGGVATVATKLV